MVELYHADTKTNGVSDFLLHLFNTDTNKRCRYRPDAMFPYAKVYHCYLTEHCMLLCIYML